MISIIITILILTGALVAVSGGSSLAITSIFKNGLMQTLKNAGGNFMEKLSASADKFTLPKIEVKESVTNEGFYQAENLIKILKATVTLAINLFIVIIETILGVLRALLPFLDK